jgi:hypothetical protein
MNVPITIAGTLHIAKGGSIAGTKDLVILKLGTLVNDGNAIVGRIINGGSITNNRMLEAVKDIYNNGKINNNSVIASGNNFNNNNGQASGTGGSYFINNSVRSTNEDAFGKDVRVLYNNDAESASQQLTGIH